MSTWYHGVIDDAHYSRIFARQRAHQCPHQGCAFSHERSIPRLNAHLLAEHKNSHRRSCPAQETSGSRLSSSPITQTPPRRPVGTGQHSTPNVHWAQVIREANQHQQRSMQIDPPVLTHPIPNWPVHHNTCSYTSQLDPGAAHTVLSRDNNRHSKFREQASPQAHGSICQ